MNIVSHSTCACTVCTVLYTVVVGCNNYWVLVPVLTAIARVFVYSRTGSSSVCTSTRYGTVLYSSLIQTAIQKHYNITILYSLTTSTVIA